MVGRGRLAERSEATRAALVATGQRLFAERGYAATTVDDVAGAAGVTKGALYHHFRDKRELFAAVYEAVEQQLAERSVRAARGARGPRAALVRGMEAFLDACLEPGVQRIVLADALAVLGWQQWHEAGARHSFAVLRAGLTAAMDAGEIARQPVDTLAHALQGASVQAGMALARAEDPARARREAARTLRRIIEGLG